MQSPENDHRNTLTVSTMSQLSATDFSSENEKLFLTRLTGNLRLKVHCATFRMIYWQKLNRILSAIISVSLPENQCGHYGGQQILLTSDEQCWRCCMSLKWAVLSCLLLCAGAAGWGSQMWTDLNWSARLGTLWGWRRTLWRWCQRGGWRGGGQCLPPTPSCAGQTLDYCQSKAHSTETHHRTPQEVIPACGHQTIQLLPQSVRQTGPWTYFTRQKLWLIIYL